MDPRAEEPGSADPARVALATCAEIPEGDDDSPALVEALRRRGVEAVSAVWDASGTDWARFDLVVVRSTWDYAERYERFLGWVDALPRVLNPAPVLRWNTDKRYLGELARAGVPVVPTRFLEPGDPFDPPGGRFVAKPAVSAGGRRAAAYVPEEAAPAREHVRRLQAEGRTVIVQPYLEAIDERGETGIVYIGGRYSHAFRKGPLLQSGQPPGEALYLEETIERRVASPAERAVADRALAALPFPVSELLYARVDLAPDPDGRPLVLEVELTEPSLYLGFRPGAADRLAQVIARAAVR